MNFEDIETIIARGDLTLIDSNSMFVDNCHTQIKLKQYWRELFEEYPNLKTTPLVFEAYKGKPARTKSEQQHCKRQTFAEKAKEQGLSDMMREYSKLVYHEFKDILKDRIVKIPDAFWQHEAVARIQNQYEKAFHVGPIHSQLILTAFSKSQHETTNIICASKNARIFYDDLTKAHLFPNNPRYISYPGISRDEFLATYQLARE